MYLKYVCIFVEKQWEDFYLGGLFKRVETTASQKAKLKEQAKACDDVFLHVHYSYVCIILHVHGAVFSRKSRNPKFRILLNACKIYCFPCIN